MYFFGMRIDLDFIAPYTSQGRRLMNELPRESRLEAAAAKAGIELKPARIYLDLKRLSSEVKPKHLCKSRKNPFEDVRDDLRGVLEVNSGLDDLLKRMGNYAEDFIFLIGEDRSIQFANVPPQAIISFFQCEGAFDQIYPRDVYEALRERIETVFELGRPLSVERSAGRPGQEIWLHTRLTPVRNESGKVHWFWV